MLLRCDAPGGSETSRPTHQSVRRACTDADDAFIAIREIRHRLGNDPMALVLLFVSPKYDRDAVAAAVARLFDGEHVVGCTTAGEICAHGYGEGGITAAGFAARDFTAATRLIPDLSAFDARETTMGVLDLRARVASERPDWHSEFAMFLGDGLSRKEDQVVATLSRNLGPTPLFGGSAGDGMDFRRTFVFEGGRFHTDAALITLVRTRCGIRVFRFDHFTPTDAQMVVTEALPGERLVREINAEPAADEYARMIGLEASQLSPRVFAAHPVVIRHGGSHHVRAIQKVEPNGDLRFYSPVDEGLVLTVAEARDMAAHLDQALSGLAAPEPPLAIIGCDCILRRLEAEETQAVGEVSRILARHGVVGFNTYGEQFDMLHVNQTLTGVAIYPAE